MQHEFVARRAREYWRSWKGAAERRWMDDQIVVIDAVCYFRLAPFLLSWSRILKLSRALTT